MQKLLLLALLVITLRVRPILADPGTVRAEVPTYPNVYDRGTIPTDNSPAATAAPRPARAPLDVAGWFREMDRSMDLMRRRMVRLDPFGGGLLGSLFDDDDDMFNAPRLLADPLWGGSGLQVMEPDNLVGHPLVDAYETDKSFHVHAELPGLGPEDVKLEARNGKLILTAEKKKEECKEGVLRENHITERRWGKFTRVIPLPKNVDASQIKADYKKGVLEIDVPKKEPAVVGHAIDIKHH